MLSLIAVLTVLTNLSDAREGCTSILVRLHDGEQLAEEGDVVDETGHRLEGQDAKLGLKKLQELAFHSTNFLRDYDSHDGQVATNSAFDVQAAYYLPNLNMGILHACKMAQTVSEGGDKALKNDSNEYDDDDDDSDSDIGESGNEVEAQSNNEVVVEMGSIENPVDEQEFDEDPVEIPTYVNIPSVGQPPDSALQELVSFLGSMTLHAGLDREDRFLV
eukprot:Protomagalhaensia_wolfi_Nauph_80__3121@NODE_318_length_2797_cov_12_520667_g240_i0_p2_GENE_NODE_318_length_2797_cov_12_520667_g240_i0NODE_318_length_2797_cov_12_520667_g240_i0_p2_ORF_typecomplete_len218_score47_98DNA_pol_phi/PF04931_13/5_1SDA1/PF05285_12/5_1_NODE_318_length_2797_cov_12_520667_g240_i010451698